MDSYRTEDEQLEAIKRWWRENGRSTVIAVLLAVGIGLGWQAWQQRRETRAAEASQRYQALLEALDAERGAGGGAAAADPRQLGDELRAAHGGSVYAPLAALHLAQLAVADGELERAEEQLRWALDAAEGDLEDVVQLRLARVLAARGDPAAALAMLGDEAGVALTPARDLARGDVLLDAGRDAEALAAYRRAAAALQGSPALPRSLQQKIDFLSPQVPDAGDAEAG